MSQLKCDSLMVFAKIHHHECFFLLVQDIFLTVHWSPLKSDKEAEAATWRFGLPVNMTEIVFWEAVFGRPRSFSLQIGEM